MTTNGRDEPLNFSTEVTPAAAQALIGRLVGDDDAEAVSETAETLDDNADDDGGVSEDQGDAPPKDVAAETDADEWITEWRDANGGERRLAGEGKPRLAKKDSEGSEVMIGARLGTMWPAQLRLGTGSGAPGDSTAVVTDLVCARAQDGVVEDGRDDENGARGAGAGSWEVAADGAGGGATDRSSWAGAAENEGSSSLGGGASVMEPSRSPLSSRCSRSSVSVRSSGGVSGRSAR